MSKNFELLERTKIGRGLCRPSTNPAGFVGTADSKLNPAQRIEPPNRAFKSAAPRISLPDSIKNKARSWIQLIQTQENQHRIELEAISREEEIKLVQRVFGSGRNSRQIVLFSHVERDADCAAICARTSEILADQSDGPVCVVDANFRSPALHRYFGVESSKGFAAAVLSSTPIQEFAQHLPERNLWVIASGARAAQLRIPLVSNRLNEKIAELRTIYKYVLIHGSPLDGDSDSILLSRWADGVVLVVEANVTRRDTARRVKENLEAANARLLGVVLNNRTFPIPETLYRKL